MLVQQPLAPPIQTYTPTLQGATNNPVATYTTQVGRYMQLGKMCFVEIFLTTSTMTKVTLTDPILINLPVAAANISGAGQVMPARLENSTPILNATHAFTTPNSTNLQLLNLPLAAASAALTYAVLSLGVLTNTITIQVSGWYETV